MAGQTLAKPRGDKTQRYVFYLGLLLAAIAAIIVFIAVSGSDGGGTATDRVPVVVANETIPAQTRVTSDMVRVEFFPLEEANAEAFTSRGQLLDRVVTEEVQAGTQIVPAMVSDNAGDGLTFKVEPGMRGVSVEVQEVVTAGGNLKPGDNVDIVGIFSVPDVGAANHILQILGLNHKLIEPPAPLDTSTEDGRQREDRLVLTVTMLQNVELLALAQTLTDTTAAGNVADDAAEADTEPRAATATLELTPQQAQEVTWGDFYGVLRMEARAVGDEGVTDLTPTLLRLEHTR